MPAYKDKTRGTWYTRFRYKDWQGKTKETTKRGFSTRRDALQYERDFKSQKAAAPSMTFAALCENYIADLRARHKASYCDTVASIIRSQLLPRLESMPLDEIKIATLQHVQTDLLQSGYSPSYLCSVNRVLKTLFDFAVKYYGLARNYMRDLPRIGKNEHRNAIWTKDDFESVLAVVTRPIDRVALLILFNTGLRLGELLALTPTDIDFAACTISVTKTLYKGTETPPKTAAARRVIACPPSLMEEIKEYLARLSYQPAHIIDISSHCLQLRFKSYIKKASAPPLTIHGLRHSHASMLVSNGIPLPAIARRLGHSSPAITMSIYAHPDLQEDAKIAAFLEESGQNVVKSNKNNP